jgi:hypothetical protein
MSERIDDFDKLLQLPCGWDGNSAFAISPDCVSRARRFVAATRMHDAQVVPCASGGVQLEQHNSMYDIEIEFKPDGSTEVFCEEATRKKCPLCGKIGEWNQNDLKIGAHYGSDFDGNVFEAHDICCECIDKIWAFLKETFPSIEGKVVNFLFVGGVDRHNDKK